MTYNEFFKKVTGNVPYPYQARLGEEVWPDLLDIPTGLGNSENDLTGEHHGFS